MKRQATRVSAPAALMFFLIAGAALADGRLSLEGQINSVTDHVSIPFSLFPPVASPGPLEFRTWSYSGGTNNAGDVIPAGGFDPILYLNNGGGTTIASDNDHA